MGRIMSRRAGLRYALAVVPTISSIEPNVGPSEGRMDVEIIGTGFVPAVLPPSGQFPGNVVPQTAIVLFDGVPAYDVRVFSGALLSATPPPHTPGVVDVSVQNVDQTTGVPISGEVVVAASSFTYVLPRVTADYPSDLVALVRTLIRAMKAYLLIEITHAVHTDYDPTTGDELHVTKFAKLPGITLIGPDLEENRFYSLNEEPDFTDETTVGDDGQPSAFVGTKVPYTVDLTFKVIAASDSKIELLNLASNFVMFMHRTKYLPMARNAADPSAGTIAYEFDFVKGGQPKTARIHSTEENKSNLRSWEAQIIVRGFDIETVFGVPNGSTAGVPNAAIVRRGYIADENQPALAPTIQQAPLETP